MNIRLSGIYRSKGTVRGEASHASNTASRRLNTWHDIDTLGTMGRRRKEITATVEQACEALGVSRSTLWRMIRRGDLPSLRQSGRRLVPIQALSARQVRRRTKKLKLFTLDHPLWRLVGAFRSGGVGPGSGDKHTLLDT